LKTLFNLKARKDICQELELKKIYLEDRFGARENPSPLRVYDNEGAEMRILCFSGFAPREGLDANLGMVYI
jgi:hypothetical protein